MRSHWTRTWCSWPYSLIYLLPCCVPYFRMYYLNWEMDANLWWGRYRWSPFLFISFSFSPPPPLSLYLCFFFHFALCAVHVAVLLFFHLVGQLSAYIVSQSVVVDNVMAVVSTKKWSVIGDFWYIFILVHFVHYIVWATTKT